MPPPSSARDSQSQVDPPHPLPPQYFFPSGGRASFTLGLSFLSPSFPPPTSFLMVKLYRWSIKGGLGGGWRGSQHPLPSQEPLCPAGGRIPPERKARWCVSGVHARNHAAVTLWQRRATRCRCHRRCRRRCPRRCLRRCHRRCCRRCRRRCPRRCHRRCHRRTRFAALLIRPCISDSHMCLTPPFWKPYFDS